MYMEKNLTFHTNVHSVRSCPSSKETLQVCIMFIIIFVAGAVYQGFEVKKVFVN
jgi:hypothetical protein